MAKNTSLQNVQEIVMATSDKNESARRTAMLKEGTLRKIAPKVYTTTMDEAPEVIMGIITSCMEPAKMKNAEATDRSTLYPASTVSIPNAIPMNR